MLVKITALQLQSIQNSFLSSVNSYKAIANVGPSIIKRSIGTLLSKSQRSSILSENSSSSQAMKSTFRASGSSANFRYSAAFFAYSKFPFLINQNLIPASCSQPTDSTTFFCIVSYAVTIPKTYRPYSSKDLQMLLIMV